MSGFEGLPDRRNSLRGVDLEGDEATLIRGISQKLYRCPGCHGEIEIGADHVIVHYVRKLGDSDYHHWHRVCATEILVPGLSRLQRVQAKQTSQGRMEGRAKDRRRDIERRRRH